MIQANHFDPDADSPNSAQIHRDSEQVVLYDPELLPEPSGSIFSLGYWRSQAAVTGTAPGRGSVWFVNAPAGEWALRHFRRGGMVSRLIADHYLWTGERRVRSFAEWRLMSGLCARGLPVARPVAASYRREGLFYTCNLITQRLPDTATLAVLMTQHGPSPGQWRAVGKTIRIFHDYGIDHADLNAHNILVDSSDGVHLIDFDRARRRSPGRWHTRNLARLHRSLRKLCPDTEHGALNAGWEMLVDAYREAGAKT